MLYLVEVEEPRQNIMSPFLACVSSIVEFPSRGAYLFEMLFAPNHLFL